MLDFFSFLWSELLDRLGEALTDTLTSAYWVGSNIHAWNQRLRFNDECEIEVLKVPEFQFEVYQPIELGLSVRYLKMKVYVLYKNLSC